MNEPTAPVVPTSAGAASLAPALAALADALWDAQVTCAPIPQPSTTTHPGLTVDEAYAVQGANIARRLAAGERVVGHKIGLTSLVMQQQIGVDSPDFGVVTDAMVVPDGGTVDPAAMVAPKLEAEFAFRIGAPLPASPTPDELRAAISDVAVAVEIIDSRVADWKIALVDTIADNASCWGIVYGPWRRATPEVLGELPRLTIGLECDGTLVAAGPGEAVMGDPLVALHWLATIIGRYGQAFAPGDVVLAGAVAAAVPFPGGTSWCAVADGFGAVVVYAAAPTTNDEE